MSVAQMMAFCVNDVDAKFRHFQCNLYGKRGTWDSHFWHFYGKNIIKENLKWTVIVVKQVFFAPF